MSAELLHHAFIDLMTYHIKDQATSIDIPWKGDKVTISIPEPLKSKFDVKITVVRGLGVWVDEDHDEVSKKFCYTGECMVNIPSTANEFDANEFDEPFLQLEHALNDLRSECLKRIAKRIEESI